MDYKNEDSVKSKWKWNQKSADKFGKGTQKGDSGEWGNVYTKLKTAFKSQSQDSDQPKSDEQRPRLR